MATGKPRAGEELERLGALPESDKVAALVVGRQHAEEIAGGLLIDLLDASEAAFRDFNRVLREAGCVLTKSGEQPEPVSELRPSCSSMVPSKDARPASKRELVALLGKDEGKEVYDRVKPKKAATS